MATLLLVWVWFACADTALSARSGCLNSTVGKNKIQHMCVSAGNIMAALVRTGPELTWSDAATALHCLSGQWTLNLYLVCRG